MEIIANIMIRDEDGYDHSKALLLTEEDLDRLILADYEDEHGEDSQLVSSEYIL